MNAYKEQHQPSTKNCEGHNQAQLPTYPQKFVKGHNPAPLPTYTQKYVKGLEPCPADKGPTLLDKRDSRQPIIP